MNVGSKIRAIRESESLTREGFETKTGISTHAIEGIEKKGRSPSAEKLQAICKAFPQYTLWLMTDTTNPEAGQISPEHERIRQDYKQVGTDG